MLGQETRLCLKRESKREKQHLEQPKVTPQGMCFGLQVKLLLSSHDEKKALAVDTGQRLFELLGLVFKVCEPSTLYTFCCRVQLCMRPGDSVE